ncbi:MAG: cation transporter [Acidobacteria bacterium]|nr:cation transporter [Acidobacteriota bacterium]MBV9477093.1 cation transporter [Acidobacteriota bacterium]
MIRIAFSLLLTFFTAVMAAADTFTFEVVGIDCAMCGPPIEKALGAVDGVKRARVDAKAKTATVEVAAGFDREKLRVAVSNAGFQAVFPGETARGIEPLPAEVVARLDIRTYADGRRVEIPAILAPGKVTIVDFYGDWCGPCRVLEARLQHLMIGGKPNLAVRRVNIGKWDNDAAKQATALRAEALPYIRVYDARGKFVVAVTGGMWDEVLAAIEKAER